MGSIIIAVSLSLFGIMCLMSLFRPHWALVLVFSFIAYEQLLTSFLSVFVYNSWLLNVITVGCVGTCLLTSIIRGEQPFRGSMNVNALLTFALYAFATASIVWSHMPEAGKYFLQSGMPNIVLMLVLVPFVVTDEDSIKKMCTPLLVMGCALIVMILISPRTTVFGTRLVIDMSYTKGSGEHGNPLATAEVGGIMLLVAALMEPRKKNIIISILRVGGISLGLLIAFLVGTRGQLMFSIFFAVLFYPIAHEIRNMKQFLIRSISIFSVMGILMIIAKFVLSSSEAGDRFSSESLAGGVSGRMYFITELFGAYASHPMNYLQGLGSGSFNRYVVRDGDGFLYPHNLIVEILTHHGVIGFTLMVVIFVLTAKHAILLIRGGLAGTIDRSVVAIVLGLSAYSFLISMKQGSFLLYPLPFYMFLIVSKLLYRMHEDAYEYDEYENYGEEEYGDYDQEEYDSSEYAY